MEWNADTAALLTRATARVSAVVFATYVAVHAATLVGRWRRPHVSAFLGAFLVAHTIHFGAVVSLTVATGGENIAVRGGSAPNLVVAATFYAVLLTIWRRQRGSRVEAAPAPVLQIVAVSLLAAAFLQAYLLRPRESWLFVLIALLLLSSYLFFLIAAVGSRRRAGRRPGH